MITRKACYHDTESVLSWILLLAVCRGSYNLCTKKQEIMTAAINKPLDTILASLAVMAMNLCNQVIAFQNAIAAREEGSRYPTEKETDLICKLVNCLDKLKKLAAPHKTQKAMNGFIRFIAEEDKELSKIIAARYKAYMAQTGGGELFDEEMAIPQAATPQAMQPTEPESQTQPEEDYEEHERIGIFVDRTRPIEFTQ